MRKITDKNEIRNFLCEHRIDNLNIAGYMHNHPDECNIWVNNGDSVRGLVLYGEETKYYIINCYDDDFIKEAVRDIFDGKEVFFSGVRKELADKLMLLGKSRKTTDIEDSCYLYYYPYKSVEGLSKNVRPLRIEDAPVIDYFYTYRSSGSLDAIKRDIQRRPGVGLELDGELVAWTLVHPDNSNGILYVKPFFRGSNLGTEVGKALTQAVIDRGDIPFVHIVNGNDASVHITEKMGFRFGYNVVWFECDFSK